MKRLAATFAILGVCAALPACIHVKPPAAQPVGSASATALWEPPANIADQDLFYGPWGAENAPDPDGVYRLLERKHTGVNMGMTVTDAEGREWSVKQAYPGGLDQEGPVEVTISRVLSAAGYHQPPVYYLPSFKLKDDFGTHVERGARFRPKPAALKETGSWQWTANPFLGSRPYQGLLVMLLMFNSTDPKDSNNSIYEYGRGERVERWYVVRDLGAALGDMNRFAPFKADPDAFERDPFIVGVSGRYVQFAYNGWYRNYVRDRITPADVRWAADLLSRLSDRQWRDAFRAGGFEPSVAERYIRKIREKIEQARDVGGTMAND